MTAKLYDVLLRRYKNRDKTKHWVFLHRYWDRKEKVLVDKPYKDRKKIMKSLCKKAKVKYFRFHALRHAGASLMDNSCVIQVLSSAYSDMKTELLLKSIFTQWGSRNVKQWIFLSRQIKVLKRITHRFTHRTGIKKRDSQG